MLLLFKSVFVGRRPVSYSSLSSVSMATNVEGRFHLKERRAKVKWKPRNRLCGEGRKDRGWLQKHRMAVSPRANNRPFESEDPGRGDEGHRTSFVNWPM